MRIAVIMVAIALAGCAHHTSPSLAPIKADIAQAGEANSETRQHIGEIRVGTDRVDYKSQRALDYFP